MSLYIPTVKDPEVQQAFEAVSKAFPLDTQLLVNEVITVTKIADGAVVADKIDVGELSAITANLGTVTAGSLEAVTIKGAILEGNTLKGETIEGGEIVGATIKTAAEGPRVEMTPSGIKGINAAEATKFTFDTTTGILTATAVLSSEEGSEIATEHLAGQITETQIEDDSISTPKLQANTIEGKHLAVETLGALKADLGTITAGTLTGATFRTSASNPKVQMDTEGLKVIESGGATGTLVDGTGMSLLQVSSAEPKNARSVRWAREAGGAAKGLVWSVESSTGNDLMLESTGAAKGEAAHITVRGSEDTSLNPAYIGAALGAGAPKRIIETGEKSAFLQLPGAAEKRRIWFGKTKIETGVEAQGWYANVTHNLGVTPVAVIACDATGTYQRIVSTDTYGATTFRAGVYRSDGAKSKTAEIAWIAIG